jgi:serine/threonine protein phosphatase PrpC
MTIDFGASTHVGMKREHNEDCFLTLPEYNLFAVCDGMGGYLAGEVASKLACDEVRQFFEMNDRDRDVTWPFKLDKALSLDENRLAVAVKLANQSVFERGHTDPKCRGMGTTFVGCLFTSDNHVVVAHAGDSRAYLFRDGELQHLTNDHSLVEEYVRLGRITAEEAKVSPQKNIILRALGQQRALDVELHTHEPEAGDIYLLCSDGLSGMLEDSHIRDMLRVQSGVGQLNACAQKMIDDANKAGGLDNITCVLVRWKAAP